ncbi:retrovirus-related pol polyprotein from transposon TNT 1-94 [Tanacetum coccineum]
MCYGKSKTTITIKPKSEDANQVKLYLLHMDLYGPMRVTSINGKKYILIIVDDYSQFTWVKFLASKDEAPDFIIKKPDLSYLHVFGALCYPNNDGEDLGKLQAKADIVQDSFQTLFLNNPVFHHQEMIGIFCFNLYSMNTLILQLLLSLQFQSVAPRAVDTTKSLVSTSIDLDAPSTNSTSYGSSLNVRPIHTPFEHLGRWTKDHPIENVIVDPSCFVSMRKQLQTDAMWCYFDAFLTSVEPKNFKQAMTELSWIDAMKKKFMNLKGYKFRNWCRVQIKSC